METGELLSLLGVGTLCSLIVTWVFTGIKDYIKKRHGDTVESREARMRHQEEKLDMILAKFDEQEKILTPAIQALLRNDLYQIYNYCILRGSRTTDETANFMNLYEKYHNLGKNGVMDVKEQDFMALPLIDN